MKISVRAEEGLSEGEGPSRSTPYTRVDDGVTEGSDISRFYDPMIAKLVTWAPTRDAAADRQVEALDRFRIEGIGHNIDFLSALMQHPRFREGRLTTGFIAEEYPDGFHGAPLDDALARKLAAIALIVDAEQRHRATTISGQLGAPIVDGGERVVTIGAHRFAHCSIDGYEGGLLASLDPAEPPLDIVCRWQPGQPLLVAKIDGAPLAVAVKGLRAGHWALTTHGAPHRVRVLPARIAALSAHMIEKIPPDMSRFLLAPMPGLLTALSVKPGDRVEPGQPLATVEAMKMENILRSQKVGTVKSVEAQPGDSLAVDQVILELE